MPTHDAEYVSFVQNDKVAQVYVAVEWLQDTDAPDGEGAKELETPSKNKVTEGPLHLSFSVCEVPCAGTGDHIRSR